MVSQSNAAGSSGRRRRQNTPKAKLVSRSKKTKRYPVSDSDDDTTPSSMDSTAPTSPPVDVVDVGSSTKFPRRLFAPGFFPTQLRLNIYSKANVIASVASALKGSSTVDRLLCSQFSKLFRLPVARCPNSTKLIGSLLCRQLITIRKYELWFTFDSETEVNEPGSMWKLLFDTTRWWTGFCVSFMNYPWGRTSFLHTISRFLPPPVSFEKTLCDHFGVLLPNIHNKGKRKMIMRPNRKSRKINSTVPKPGQEMHSYPLRSADGLEGTIGNTQPGFSRETRENNENSTLLTPQFDQNATDQQRRNFSIFILGCSHCLQKDDTYIGEKAVDVKWDEANPHAYSSVKEVPAQGGVPDSMAVQNPTSPVEEDENYESYKENISFDSQLQGKQPRAVEDMPGSETDEDDNYVESGGKRVPKKSQKIRRVYTPDARLKGLFMSEKKAEYRPIPKTNRAIFKKFSDILSENIDQ
ncbi:unnamed protein product [Brassica oleracea]